MVRKNRTDMPFCVCPRCSRTTTVGKLYGGTKILYYCHDCYVEFSVNPEIKGGPICTINYSFGAKITPEKFKWVGSEERWERISDAKKNKKKTRK